MISRRKKQPPLIRSPHLQRQKQTTFRYSSNRSQAERPLARTDTQEAEKKVRAKSNLLRKFKRTPYLLGGIGLLAGAVYFSLLMTAPQVVIRGDQASLRSSAAYDHLVSESTNNLYSRSKFTINRQKITDELQNQYPELSSVHVTTPLFLNHAVIKLEIAQPQLVLSSGTDMFLLDNSGVALLNIAKDPITYKTDKLPIVADQSNTRVDIGKPALTSTQVTFITEVIRQAQAKGLSVESTNLSAGAGELAVRYTGVPYFVKYSLSEDARKSFGTFIATKEYIERTNVKPAEYIDVRIPERAYVK